MLSHDSTEETLLVWQAVNIISERMSIFIEISYHEKRAQILQY